MTFPAVCVTVRKLGTSGDTSGDELDGGSGMPWTECVNEDVEVEATGFWLLDLFIWMSRRMKGKVSGVSWSSG